MKQRIGLIGCGNMGSAILRGVIKKKLARTSRVTVYDSVRRKVTMLSRALGVRVAQSNSEVLAKSQIVLLAIKPQDLSAFGRDAKPYLRKNHVVISILAGTPVWKLRRALGSGVRLVRAMPNLGAQVGASVTVLTSSRPAALLSAERLFSGCGRVLRLSEKHFDVVTAVSGSGPAYFFLMMELLAEVGRRKGLSQAASELLAIETAVGAGKLAQASGVSPARLRKMVTSKKGTTEAALKFLHRHKFSKTFTGGVERAIRRSRELSRS
jgi:pyrroline-5-carboxylate reductase